MRKQEIRVANVDERDLLGDESFRRALREFAASRSLPPDEIEEEARRCLDELSVRPADRYLGWVSRLARFMVTRSFERDFDVNHDALDALKAQAASRPLIFLWSHKSHLDSFVFMQTLYAANFRPQPLSFAGINMAFAGFSALARHSGAIFLRRSFRDDEVYKLVLRHFIDYLILKRAPLSWSIEGTRSRTGKLMPPKLGLLQWVIDACHRAASDDALLVPVTISFDQIPEIDDYIAMQRGMPKRKESLKWFVDYITGMQANYGRIYVRFAEPVTLSTPVEIPREMLPADADKARVQVLAYEVCSRIEHAKPINATDVISLVMLGANNRRLSAETIAARAGEIVDVAEQRKLPQAGDLRAATGTELAVTLETLCTTGLLERVEAAGATDYAIAKGKELAAAYYRNTVAHYFLANAIAEVALVASRRDSPETSVQQEALALRDLLKFEFFFKARAPFLDDVTTYLDTRWPEWRSGAAAMETHSPPQFGSGILRSCMEAYSILARLLVANDAQDAGAADDKALVRTCLRRGEAMLEEGEISTQAALSLPIFETGLELARHRQLMDEDDDLCVSRREAFSDELERVLTAINRLQHYQDRQSPDAVDDTGHARRSIA